MTEEIDPNSEMIQAFAAWRLAEDEVTVLETKKQRLIADMDKQIQDHKIIETDARLAVEALMNKNGITEDILPGSGCDYKINFKLPPEVVKIVDEAAIPDKFIEEKKPEKVVKKRELLIHLKQQRDLNVALPNYATIERGPRKLMWSAVKK